MTEMGSRWAIAFLVATWFAIAGNAVLRSLARSSVRWRDPEFWALQLRLLGGPVLAIAALLGALAAPGAPTRLGIAAAAAAVLAVLGVADHRREMRTELRVAIITVAATVVVLAGLRVSVLGSTFLDSLLTIGWIVLVTNAYRRLDHLDGLVAAIGAGAAAGMFGVTATSGNDPVSTVCAALAGACLGALVYNVRPASTVLGSAGASFIGFVLAVALVEFKPAEASPGGVVLAALLLGVPVLDLLVVTCTRLWRGVPLRTRKPDHLLHRLLRKGWSRDEATILLVLTQCLLSGLAVLVARGWVSSWLGLLVGVVLASALVLLGAPEPRIERRGRPRSRVLLLGGVGLVVVLGALGGLAVSQGVRQVEQAQDALQRALRLGRQGDTEQAELELADARDHFARASSWVSSPLGWPGRLVPVVAENLRAARELSDGGRRVSEAGLRLARAANTRLQVSDGTVRVDAVRDIEPELEGATELLRQVVARVDDLQLPYLVTPVKERVVRAARELDQVVGEAGNAVAAAKVAPAVFGGDRPRRYFLAIQNPAELRATGGIIGNWGILDVDGGKVTLQDVSRTRELNEDPVPPGGSARTLDAPPEYLDRYARFTPAQIWQNLNVTPDFPTVGRLIAGLYPQSGGAPIDGVIAVDPVGLSTLLRFTGPVVVPNWPVPIDAANVVDVTLRQAYDAFDLQEREDFLGDVAETVWRRATTMDLGSPAKLARRFGEAGREGHLMLWFPDEREQALAVRLGVAGDVPQLRSDSLFVNTQNAAGNKVDYYLKRGLEYTVELRPDDRLLSARAEGRLQVRLDNGAPSAGASDYAIGPFDARFEPGEGRSFTSVYSPLGFTAATLDGQPTQLETGRELGRNVFSEFISVPSRQARTLSLRLAGTVPLDRGGWYTLDLVRQPTLLPDLVSVRVEVPPGYRVRDAEGIEVLGPHTAGGDLALTETGRVRVRIGLDPSSRG
jgi:UDP-N-acetylmuramyl pentapeptide phosphotransferase/UDP-N-acetylglucosamine-1-phosphate transferase